MKDEHKRSNEPIFWGLFGAGGMWSAIFAPVVILVLLIFPAVGLNMASGKAWLYAYGTFLGRAFMFFMIVLPLWAGVHRIHHTLHDLKVHSPLVKPICYGGAAVITVLTLILLIVR